MLFVSCNSKPAPPSLYFGVDYVLIDCESDTNIDKQSGTDTINTKPDEENNSIIRQIYDIWSYSPQPISIPEQTSIERAAYDLYPNMRGSYRYDNVGGIKLIGEMSADRAGYNYSYYTYPIAFNILSLSQLHLEIISSPINIICLIVQRIVAIESAKVTSGPNGLCVEIDVRNLTQMHQEVEFVQGQMIEVTEPHVQNVVVSSNTKAQLCPNGNSIFKLPVYCASHHRSSPSGSYARITPYVLIATTSTFQSQQNIWNVIESEDDPNSYVTFYVWGKGDITESGRNSLTGHAFIRIPYVGVWGFGSLHGGLLNDEGVISDHTSKIRFATDSCRIKVSNEAIKKMTEKIRQLQHNVPKYSIGHYDCTSFVMDIADVGGIHYGARIAIQTPVGFMQELKKHNYLH